MSRQAAKSTLLGLILGLSIAGFPLTARAVADSVVGVTSAGSLGANDSLSWSQLGADGVTQAATLNATSIGSIAVTASLAANGSLVAVVCPAAQCSWGSPGNGGFAAGDSLLWTSDTANGGTGPLKLTFKTSVKGVGATIQADGPAQFTAQIQAFNGKKLLKALTAASDANGDAVFLGALDQTAAHITSVTYSLTKCTGACTDFAIDTLFINSGS